MNALIQEKYLRDGIYRFYGTCCNRVIDTDWRMQDFCKPDQECKEFPIKFCWGCGKKFDQFVY